MLFVLGSGVILNALVRSGRLATATRGLVFGLFATMGILLGFLLVGLPVALLAGVLAPYLPLVSALVGAVILLLGVAALAGRSLAPRLPALAAGDVSRPSGFLKFGLAYAVAGLSCTFPAFLAVMAAGVATGGFATALLTFVAYASGKATILIGVTAIIVAGGEGLAPKLKAHARHAEKVSGALLVLAGLFMLYYFALPLVIAG
jgi:cytochrome c biogenesis protein CcdA